MADEPSDSSPASEPNRAGGSRGDYTLGEVQHRQLSARVPEAVARGVFSTGAIIIGGATEFVLDFCLRMVRPHQVVARVVLPPPVLPQMIAALNESIAGYEARLGPIPPLPAPASERTPSLQEVYEELKLSDEQLSGAYANVVMIAYGGAEFCLDFVSGFFPRSAVSSRVYMAAPHVLRLRDSLTQTHAEHLRRLAARRNPPASPPPDAEGPPPG